MDKPTANPKEQLTQHELVSNSGGHVICVPVSALTGDGISDLLEKISIRSRRKRAESN